MRSPARFVIRTRKIDQKKVGPSKFDTCNRCSFHFRIFLKAQIFKILLLLTLQVCFLVNVFLQVYCDIGNLVGWFKGLGPCAIFAHLFILGLDFVFVCILYTPVMWALAGWHGFTRITMDHVKGDLFAKGGVKIYGVPGPGPSTGGEDFFQLKARTKTNFSQNPA